MSLQSISFYKLTHTRFFTSSRIFSAFSNQHNLPIKESRLSNTSDLKNFSSCTPNLALPIKKLNILSQPNELFVAQLKRNMFIQVQNTPNPNSMKFVPGVQVKWVWFRFKFNMILLFVCTIMIFSSNQIIHHMNY